MSVGWVRAYEEELRRFGYRDRDHRERDERAQFREAFTTSLRAGPADTDAGIEDLSWGEIVELPSGLGDGEWTRVEHDGRAGFVRSAHLVEIAYVDRRAGVNGFRTTLTYERREPDGSTRTVRIALLWGDCVQIIRRQGASCYGRARSFFGDIPSSHLADKPLLEVYFIDVGQGDGVLVRTPDERHLLVDGGLERVKQLTGKNVADFVDWKFYTDYGHYEIRLDSMTASHSDNDHYGGLHDLVRQDPVTERELDCRRTRIEAFHHPGLSRWENRADADPPHKDGLGGRVEDDGAYFVRLLGDRRDAEGAIVNDAADELSGPWKWFIRDVLANSNDTSFERVGVTRDMLASGKLPSLWDDAEGYDIKVLAPVSEEKNGSPALPDLGSRGYNTNGHSVCYRIDYGKARILLTGDLNKPSMDWISSAYGDWMGAWRCDVAKACHHGSHKISYRFLQAMQPAATVISSGDAEGYAHPRPEIVAASAVSGRIEIDYDNDVLVTPLIYMTEIERSVSLGALDRLDIAGLPGPSETSSIEVPGRYVDELNDKALLSAEQEEQIAEAPEDERRSLRTELRKETRDHFRAIENGRESGTYTAQLSMTVPRGPLSAEYRSRSLWRARILDRNHYGLVNVRTDGDVIMCATLNETESDWLVHTFVARANAAWDPGDSASR